ncbi:MAG: pyridoxamine 5'-phosphate oxidase family protein [Bacteroidales bacterium]|nr:pyridoxamine 5'-phosphate oxidase family protein [Bacteroidales bacterium]
MNEIDKRIIEFINKHHVLTLSTTRNNIPYSANCFYVYFEDENMLVFTSDYETKHAQDATKQNIVAGSIVLETNVVGKIQGVQLQGKMYEPKEDLLKRVKARYLKRFPVAMLMKTNLWVVELSFLKFTDNRLGFGKKLIWGKEASENIS